MRKSINYQISALERHIVCLSRGPLVCEDIEARLQACEVALMLPSDYPVLQPDVNTKRNACGDFFSIP